MRRRRRDRHRPSLPPRSIPRRKEKKKKELLTGAAKGWGRERERERDPFLPWGRPFPWRLQIASFLLLSREDWRERGGRGENSLSSDTIPNSPHVKYSPAARTHILIFRPQHANTATKPRFFLSPYVSFLRWWPPRNRKKAQQRYSPFSLWRRL